MLNLNCTKDIASSFNIESRKDNIAFQKDMRSPSICAFSPRQCLRVLCPL